MVMEGGVKWLRILRIVGTDFTDVFTEKGGPRLSG